MVEGEEEHVEEPRKTGLTIDEVLNYVGGFGRFQLGLVAVISYVKLFTGALQLLAPAFLAAEPPWTCAMNSTVCNVSGSIAAGHAHYGLRCSVPRHEWVFDTSQFNSVVSEWDLVCERSSLSSLSKSVVFAGYLIGVLSGGVLSDKLGRKYALFFPSVLVNVFALVASFANTFWIFAVLRGLVGVGLGMSTLPGMVLLMEYLDTQHRSKTLYVYYTWVVGASSIPLWAYLLPNWRSLSIALAAPGLLQVFMWRCIPRSSRWLLVNGHYDEAFKILEQVAKVNGKEMPKLPLTKVVDNQRKGDLRDLFRSLDMVHKTIVCWICWTGTEVLYFGVMFGAGSFGGNRYLVFFVTGVIDLPAQYIVIRAMDRLGRKKTIVGALICSAVFSACAVVLQSNMTDKGFLAGRIIMSLMAKFFISMVFAGNYVFTGEIFPTVIRNVAMATSSACGKIGSLCAPFIVWLVRIHVLLPYSIMAAIVFTAAILCCTLPETAGEPTPEVFKKALVVTTSKGENDPFIRQRKDESSKVNM